MTAAKPQTIQVYLPSGDPRGIRKADITTRIMQVVEVPRTQLDTFLAMPEAQRVSVYFLVNPGGDTETPQIYIGQTGDLVARTADHGKRKEFWQRAMFACSKTQSLTQTHTLYLEWLFIQEARKLARYEVTNRTGGTKPYVTEVLQAECEEMFETVRILLATLGCLAFEPGTEKKPSEVTTLYCRSSGGDGRGYLGDDGFMVLAGSSGRKEVVESIKGTADERFRQRLIDSGVLKSEGERLVFTKDHLFGSPSMAAVALLGRTANGWREWKDEAGRTLHDLVRAPEGAAS
jgi:hypothetical protein